MVFSKLRKVWNPSMFQGKMGFKQYFEGWYYKNVAGTEDHIHVFIPGISLTDDKNKDHAFIQWLNGKTGEFSYFRFDISNFTFSSKRFEVAIGTNTFSLDRFHIDIDQQDHRIHGSVSIIDPVVFPKSLFYPGVMGWYTFVPFMQCKHGVVSLNHCLEGSLLIDDRTVNFDGGKGYIEKDFGKSFPVAYIWMQSNHFDDKELSLMVSLATIPWFRRSFTGCLCVMWYDDTVFNLSTYRGGKVTQFKRTGNELDLMIENRNFLLVVKAVKEKGWPIKSPEMGEMSARIFESLTSTIEIKFFRKAVLGRELIVSGVGRNAGVEMMDDQHVLLKGLKK